MRDESRGTRLKERYPPEVQEFIDWQARSRMGAYWEAWWPPGQTARRRGRSGAGRRHDRWLVLLLVFMLALIGGSYLLMLLQFLSR